MGIIPVAARPIPGGRPAVPAVSYAAVAGSSTASACVPPIAAATPPTRMASTIWASAPFGGRKFLAFYLLDKCAALIRRVSGIKKGGRTAPSFLFSLWGTHHTIVGKLVQLAKNQCLEHQHCVVWRTSLAILSSILSHGFLEVAFIF